MQIYSSRDGDTLWSGKDDDEPEYIHMLFRQAQEDAIAERKKEKEMMAKKEAARKQKLEDIPVFSFFAIFSHYCS